jgi:polyhydroxybutyrate depolymerase
MKHIRLILFWAITLLFVCAELPAQTVVEGSFDHDGINRTYRLYIPEVYDAGTAVPLLFNLHGYGSDNLEQEVYGDFRPIADTANFIIAHPNGTFDLFNQRFWNTFGGASIDDVGFISALIDTISAVYNIDPNRIYSTGMSNGGFMSYDLACFLSHRITAVASVTGSMIWERFNTCEPTHPTPVMQIHGTADATVLYNGSFLFSHIDTLVSYWVNFNNCQSDPTIIQVPDIDTLDGCTAEQHIFSGGNAGVSVELFKVIDGGHSWPGAPINLNVTNMDFSASVEIWRFFSQYSLDQLLNIIGEETISSRVIHAFPNPAGNTLILDFPAFDRPVAATLEVYNLHGQPIHSQNISDLQHQTILDVNAWPPGMYLLRVKAMNGITVNGKVMVRK